MLSSTPCNEIEIKTSPMLVDFNAIYTKPDLYQTMKILTLLKSNHLIYVYKKQTSKNTLISFFFTTVTYKRPRKITKFQLVKPETFVTMILKEILKIKQTYGEKNELMILHRFSWMIGMTCCCIAFVGLMALAIKKISSTKSVQPINIPSISAELTENIQAIHSSRRDEQQNTFELQVVESHSRIINVAPIHLEEQIFGSLDDIDTIQQSNLSIEFNEFNSIGVENPGSEETPRAPNQMLCFNNQKFNPSLISFPVLTFLCVIFLIVFPIYVWHIHLGNYFENHALKAHIFYSYTIVLPTVYFILNPKHLTKATKLIFYGL